MNARKSMVRKLTQIGTVRMAARAVMKIGFVVDRVWSHARFRALVPSAGEVVCHWTVEIKYPQNLAIGNNVRIGPHATIGAKSKITIGDDVVVSRGAILETAGLDLNAGIPYPHVSKPIVIKRGVWVAANAIVLGGVTIGEDAVIGAGSVVGRDVPANAVVKPAKCVVHIRSGNDKPQATSTDPAR